MTLMMAFLSKTPDSHKPALKNHEPDTWMLFLGFIDIDFGNSI
jgi:hypothetical protein